VSFSLRVDPFFPLFSISEKGNPLPFVVALTGPVKITGDYGDPFFFFQVSPDPLFLRVPQRLQKTSEKASFLHTFESDFDSPPPHRFQTPKPLFFWGSSKVERTSFSCLMSQSRSSSSACVSVHLFRSFLIHLPGCRPLPLRSSPRSPP